ncbi:MAG TPA: glycosyltransferase family 4 protein [Candidatus Woesebacteria bacterium]|nr:glycosyltransferase family 4 protein [Candidatus Woesebacteria bacterium]
MKPKIAVVRGKFLNRYEMQTFEYLTDQFDLTAFGSKTPFHDTFSFPVKKMVSPMDVPDFPYKMQLLNRLFVDAHYLHGLEKSLKGFDIAHSAETYYRYTQQCLNAKQKGCIKKVVVTVLENIPHNNEGIRGRKSYKKRTRDEVDVLIALTQKTKKALITEGADEKKIKVIGSGIDTKHFYPRKNKTNNKIRILFVGRFEEYKGVFNVLHSAKELLTQKNDIPLEFIFVGKGSQEQKMKILAHTLEIQKNVLFTSVPYEKIADIYRSADIFVAPSIDTDTWQEQYGYMLLEAQASGLPIVTTKSGSIPEVVGDAAILVEQQNVKQLTTALTSFIHNQNLRKEYAKKSRTRAETVHDSRVIAQKIADVYTSLL